MLSFEVDGPYGEMVGEVVICPECADHGMGVDELVVHGALHLGGMDHGEDFGPVRWRASSGRNGGVAWRGRVNDRTKVSRA